MLTEKKIMLPFVSEKKIQCQEKPPPPRISNGRSLTQLWISLSKTGLSIESVAFKEDMLPIKQHLIFDCEDLPINDKWTFSSLSFGQSTFTFRGFRSNF